MQNIDVSKLIILPVVFIMSSFILLMVASGLVRARQQRAYPFDTPKSTQSLWRDLYDESFTSLLVFWAGRFMASVCTHLPRTRFCKGIENASTRPSV